GERQLARLSINAEHGDVVRPLVARVEELPRRIETKTARIITTCPFLGDERQFPRLPDRKYGNAVVQSVACVDKPSIAGDQELGAEITAGESGRQAGDGLTVCEPPRHGVVIKQNDGRTFLL